MSATTSSASATSESRRFYLEIFVVSFAALMLEISYTRLISFKLFYYYTYLIIGFALMGLGSGAIVVAILPALRRLELQVLLARSCALGALTVALGYVVIALVPLNALELTQSFGALSSHLDEIAKLVAVCAALFATFACVGVMIAALFSTHPEAIHRLYFADLAGAALACLAVVPLLGTIGPPSCIALAGLVLAATGVRLALGGERIALAVAVAAGLWQAAAIAIPGLLPNLVTDSAKTVRDGDESRLFFSKWSPVFRIDVTRHPVHEGDDHRIIHHDGLWGSTLHRFDGDASSLTRFESDVRRVAFRTPERAPRRVLIIGAAGGHEILASLYFGAEKVTAVELNPVTASLLTTVFPDYSGRLHEDPRVELVNDEGRAFLARNRERFDLIYFVAPDSYSAMNAATAGAFVLSESYLYTVEMIEESLGRLSDDGVICMQFGEFDYENKPNRTARYVGTAREAFRRLGVDDFRSHVMVATSPEFIPISTVLLKRQPFTEAERGRFVAHGERVEGLAPRFALGRVVDPGPVSRAIRAQPEALRAWYAQHRYDLTPITDDSPFFWHFARFGNVLREFGRPLGHDSEDSIGERLLLIMLGVSALFATLFLLLPFVAVRDVWARLPYKGRTALYFAALGLGFLFFEISLIQKLTLFVGYPTYSLTVTLLSILLFTGIGSLASGTYDVPRDRLLGMLFAVLVVLTLFYQFGLGPLTELFLPLALPARVVLASLVLAPLGLCLGAFMPLGLATVSELGDHPAEYVAWGWAVNGFFSVISSVLTTILSMTFGFQAVLTLGLAVYAIGILALRAVPSPEGR